MPTLEQADPSILYCMFKGEPGTRKSTQALSFPTPQYWFSWDRKMSSLLLPMRAWGMNPTEIEYDDYDDWSKARQKLEQFQVKCKYKTLILDSLTSLADSALRQTMSLKKGATRSSGAAAGRIVGGIAINELEDYGAESSALMEAISLTKDICGYHKVNIILIAHVIQAEYKTAGVTHMSRTIVTAGKRVAPKIPGYCGEVYHFNIEKGYAADGSGGTYALLTTHTGDDFARTGLPLPAKIEFGDNPIYKTWLEPAINKLKGDIINEKSLTPPQSPQPSTFTVK